MQLIQHTTSFEMRFIHVFQARISNPGHTGPRTKNFRSAADKTCMAVKETPTCGPTTGSQPVPTGTHGPITHRWDGRRWSSSFFLPFQWTVEEPVTASHCRTGHGPNPKPFYIPSSTFRSSTFPISKARALSRSYTLPLPQISHLSCSTVEIWWRDHRVNGRRSSPPIRWAASASPIGQLISLSFSRSID